MPASSFCWVACKKGQAGIGSPFDASACANWLSAGSQLMAGSLWLGCSPACRADILRLG